ncbi:MAG: hypothetical protein KF784_07680 [Fimbriimonadaceae bacterium]|nr:hypothetical protein [Fimbriimonadaceae bacterium]
MATRRRKSAHEKLIIDRGPEIAVMDKPYAGVPAGKKVLVPTPMQVKAYIEAIPAGQMRTPTEMREDLRREFDADATCPLVCGIFIRLVTEAAMIDLSEGKTLDDVSPFWRIVDRKSPVVKKLNLDPDWLDQLRANEAS